MKKRYVDLIGMMLCIMGSVCLSVSCGGGSSDPNWTVIEIANGDFNSPQGEASTAFITGVEDWSAGDNAVTLGLFGSGESWDGAGQIWPGNIDNNNSLVQTLETVYEPGEYRLAAIIWGGQDGEENADLKSRIAFYYNDGAADVLLAEDSESPGFGHPVAAASWLGQSLTISVEPGSPAVGNPIIIELEATGVSNSTGSSDIRCCWDNVGLEYR